MRPFGPGGISGEQPPGAGHVEIEVTNGASRVYVDWPDGSSTDHEVPDNGELSLDIPPGMPAGIVFVSDMNVPNPADDSFEIGQLD